MPILVLLFALIALIYGAVRAFDALAVRFGEDIAIGVAALVLALVAAALAYFVQRRRDVAANLRGEGDWTHGVAGDWGEVRLAAGKRLCDVRVGQARGSYIFADLRGAQTRREPDGWRVALEVADREHGVWLLPMRSEREAKRWTRIFGLAIEQRL